MDKDRKKVVTKSEALKKAAAYCALQERCQQEVREKLHTWNVFGVDAEQVIAELIPSGFINEERFAKAFAGGKFRIKKWGRIKIKTELKRKNISEYCINKGLKEIPDTEYKTILKEIILKKSKETKEKNRYRKLNKIASFAIQKGYESEFVWDVIREMFIK